MIELKNFTENHSLVEDQQGNPYAYDHSKYKWYEADDETELQIYPINKDGYADFTTSIKVKKKELTPKFIKLVPPR